MVDVVLDQSIDVPEAIYVDGQEQRNWFGECLLQATAVQCPKVSQRRSRFQITNPPLFTFILSG